MESTMKDTNIALGEHRDLLDIIDTLRSQGVSHYIDLPEIIVCGDQSAGKSSVLEAISGMPFPTKDGLCTRFATELILRRGTETTTKVSITAGENQFGEDKERLERWQPTASIEKDGLGAVTDEAKRAMAVSAIAREFFDDTLRIELTGPDQPHLTMVDLPGLFRTGNKEQSSTDVGIVRNMVKRYMARPRSIILTVVSAKYDYVLQEVTLMAKEADPEGLRTMGLITKPDTLDVGSDSETYFVRLAQNIEDPLRLGWHVMKNRNFEERDISSVERDSIESEFFHQGLWASVDPSWCGVSALRVRLSAVLREQILSQLPSLLRDVEEGIQDCAMRLNRLGPIRSTHDQQFRYLLQLSEEYTSLMNQAVDGTYTDPFFGSRKAKGTFTKRLRAVVERLRSDFSENMRLNGQRVYIIDPDSDDDEGSGEVRDVAQVTRPVYVEQVANRLVYSKGRELPGLFNPLVVGDLFIEQCEPWSGITKLLTEEILDAVHVTTELIVQHLTPTDISEGILKLLRREIEKLRIEMNDHVDALLASASQHPITYNTDLTNNVQRTQQARQKRAMKNAIQRTFGSTRFDRPDNKISTNPLELMKLMGDAFEPNMERFGSALAVDYMEAYYKVALKRFIDDVSILAIEDCLISKLSTIFRSENVVKMTHEEVSRLAGETEESSAERKRLETKRGILETGLRGLKDLHKRRSFAYHPKPDQAASESLVPKTPSVASLSEEASSTIEITNRPSPPVPRPLRSVSSQEDSRSSTPE